MSDYHAIQLTGSACQGKNCACASCAMAIAGGTGGKVLLSADRVRAQSGISCVAGGDTPSGGLFIGDVIAVCARNGVVIDYGRAPFTYYKRWPASEASRLVGAWGAVFLGDYDGLPRLYRAAGSSFLGDHSAYGHNYRTDLPAFGSGQPTATICWHDPLRSKPIRLPLSALYGYWQKPGSPIKGFAGFVRLPAAAAARPKPWWAGNITADIKRAYTPAAVAKKLRALGITNYGDALNYSDLEAGLRKRRIDFKTSVQLTDVRDLMKPGTGR